MKSDGRYIASEAKFLRYAELALAHRFPNQEAFKSFYEALPNPSAKDEFLGIASFYLFLVKNGEWVNSIEGTPQAVEYLTNSFRLVAMFSLIETLSGTQHQDFYRWLCSSKEQDVFPIMRLCNLTQLYSQYNRSHGATNYCVAFFERLGAARKAQLMTAIKVRGQPMRSLKRVVQLLYGLRSRFVHRSDLVLLLMNQQILSTIDGKIHHSTLTFGTLTDVFEEALLAYFAWKHTLALQGSLNSGVAAVEAP